MWGSMDGTHRRSGAVAAAAVWARGKPDGHRCSREGQTDRRAGKGWAFGSGWQAGRQADRQMDRWTDQDGRLPTTASGLMVKPYLHQNCVQLRRLRSFSGQGALSNAFPLPKTHIFDLWDSRMTSRGRALQIYGPLMPARRLSIAAVEEHSEGLFSARDAGHTSETNRIHLVLLAFRIGHLVPIWQPIIGPSVHLCQVDQGQRRCVLRAVLRA
jgi:hypothetical protein